VGVVELAHYEEYLLCNPAGDGIRLRDFGADGVGWGSFVWDSQSRMSAA
jgi:hypothetical protein